MSERHREAFAHLVYGLNSEGAFILLSGDVGTGKTTVSRCLLEQIPQNTNLALILNPKVSAQELLDTICDELGVAYSRTHPSIKHRVDQINLFLLRSYAEGKRTVVLIDEAQNLDIEVLEQLRLLTNLETNEHKLLQIILLGQPELLDILARPELSQLAQRITARYHLSPLNKKEIITYVSHRLGVAGCNRVVFSNSVLKKLFKLSGGIPRLVNVLCDRALLGAYVQNRHHVDQRTLEKAAKEVFGEQKTTINKRGQFFTSRWMLPVYLTFIVGLVSVLYFNYQSVVDEKNQIADELKAMEAELSAVEKSPSTVEAQLVWPDEVTRLRSNSVAFQSLFQRWNMSYKPMENGTPCFYAQTKGLTCMENQGDIAYLRILNRPAVLSLYDGTGNIYYAALIGLDDQNAVLDFAGTEQKVSVQQLEKFWQGEFVLLWNKPPGYELSIKPGYQGDEVRWITRKLNQINQTNFLPETSVYKAELVEMIKQFQLSQGIEADGIVGEQTLIHINDATGINAPMLGKRS
ncbi:MAG: AAA family ATPase [Gammaproteobacteria bacterium]|nr:AAA family ATPase [Gammaproteobacteria bacterium]MCW8910901.1 AAA family ATPase [Gammaproteobacteria bacterium]MCW9004591.1 AAA family ATPase [Gammaproteobacteria bacterium]MCW9056715.1 AAA family ATPase [Gammaproteobacteria bacterium]